MVDDSQSNNTQGMAVGACVPPPESSPLVAAARVLVFVGALSLIALGLLAGGIGLLGNLLQPDDGLILTTACASAMALAVGLGSALAWQAWQSIQGRTSYWYQPRLVGVWVIVFFFTVLLGQIVLGSDLMPQLAFPPLHILASILPPVIVIAWVARSLGGITRNRDVVFQLSSGALVATVLAFSLETVLVIGTLATVLAIVAMQPGGLEQIQTLAGHLQDSAWLEDPGNLSSLARSPFVIASAFFIFAIAVPLIEEAVKTVGVPLRAYRRPSMPQALLWGLAGGAGFALAEGLFNSLGGIESWAVIVSFRVGATLLHCFTGALMGLAWYHVLATRRWGWALGLYALSASIHGLWNTLVAASAFASLLTQTGETTVLNQMAGEVGTVAAISLLALLTLAIALSLARLTHLVRNRSVATSPRTQTDPLGGETVVTTDNAGT